LRLDLHIHTTASDGAWSPGEVVNEAVVAGLDVIAITDHDTVAGVATAQERASNFSIQVISGIEVSSTYGTADIHVLGYFVDPRSPVLIEHGRIAGSRRAERMREMIERLDRMEIKISYGAVVDEAGPEGVVIGRPHLAKALVKAGYAKSVWDAFERLIGNESRAFVPTNLLEPAAAINLVREAGGIPLWAHPPEELVDSLLPLLLEAGLRGLEVYRPRSKKTDVLRLESICKANGLLMSGGSDWHNPQHGRALGDFYVDAHEIEDLLHAGGL